jgi:hypothetical protein
MLGLRLLSSVRLLRAGLALVVLPVAVGCAGPRTVMIDGREVQRPAYQFSGQPFTVKHESAYPQAGDPSSGLRAGGGSIRGRVCGMNLDLDVDHKGDHVQLVGSIDNRAPFAVDVRGGSSALHFTGNLSGLGVDFVADESKIEGHVGLRVFSLDRENDGYQGFMHVPGLLGDGRMGIMIRGAAALWKMPAADIGAVLPALITCDGFRRKRIVSAVQVGIGGTLTDAPPESSSVFSGGR